MKISPAATSGRKKLTFSFSPKENMRVNIIKPQDLKLGGPPVLAWPKDPKTSVIRNGSRLNEVLVVRLDPAELDDETRAHAADGIVAYSAICAHAGCPVTAWVKGGRGRQGRLQMRLPQFRI